MRIQHTPGNKKKYVYAAVAAVAVCLLATGALAYKYQWGPFDQTPSAEELKEAQNNSDTTNDQVKGGKDQPTDPNIDTSKTTDDIPVSSSATITITGIVQQNGNVTLSSSLQNPGETGTCSVLFTSDVAKPVSRTVTATDGSCPDITIPEQEFSAIGTWEATLRYYTGDTQAVDTKTIEIQ